NGPLTLRRNGTFFITPPDHASGTWDIASPGNKLLLNWFRWPKDQLTPLEGGGYASKSLRLIPKLEGKNEIQKNSLAVFTRVCVDDYPIFQIWVEYYTRRYSEIRCCIFQRECDDISDILAFCDMHGILYEILKADTFDNIPTFDVLQELTSTTNAKIGLVVDCDEFVNDFDELDKIVANMPADSVILKMVDRVSFDIFYDISGCRCYEDLCRLAPLSTNITSSIQQWRDEKCCITTLPDLGLLHDPSPGRSTQLLKNIHLDHFKWRLEWLPKAKRRLQEVKELGYVWQAGLRRAIMNLDNNRPKRHLTLAGTFDHYAIYEELCQTLPNEARMVELGVKSGKSLAYFAEYARHIGKTFKIYGADPFKERRADADNPESYRLADTLRDLELRDLHHDVELIQASTADAALHFADNSVDFVWLDAAPTLAEMMKNLVAWWPKIKPGGTLGGRDLPLYHVPEALHMLKLPYVQIQTSWICRNIPKERLDLLIPR
ncbi:MAG: class I SAM-dependent methyltransferase, partial [Chthoniobacterales bacterium]